MPLKGADRTEESAINLTPMIDIVFLLIIFFLVGARFTEQERQYDIQLPSSSEIQPERGLIIVGAWVMRVLAWLPVTELDS